MAFKKDLNEIKNNKEIHKSTNPLLLVSVLVYLLVIGILYITMMIFFFDAHISLQMFIFMYSLLDKYSYLLIILPLLPLSSFIVEDKYPLSSKNAHMIILLVSILMLIGVAGMIFSERIIFYISSEIIVVVTVFIMIIYLWISGEI